VTGDRYVTKGSWDSINVVEVLEESSTKATYKLTTTVILHMDVDKELVGKTSLSGSLTRQVTAYFLFSKKAFKYINIS
jgi:capping protein (actin filament) muscle Z-line, beta